MAVIAKFNSLRIVLLCSVTRTKAQFAVPLTRLNRGKETVSRIESRGTPVREGEVVNPKSRTLFCLGFFFLLFFGGNMKCWLNAPVFCKERQQQNLVISFRNYVSRKVDNTALSKICFLGFFIGFHMFYTKS